MGKFLKLIAILVLAASGQASYAVVEFDLNTVINGSTPSGPAPWMTATFEDGATDHVTLTLTNNMGSGQFITDLVFNSLVNPSSLIFTRTDAPPPNVSNPPGIQASVGQIFDGGSDLKAGLFNIWIPFSPSGGPTNQFNSTNSPVIFDILGSGLTEGSFVMLSADGGPGFLGTDYFMAAKVQGIPCVGESCQTLSGSIGTTAAIPEPEIYAMMGIGLALMSFMARRRKQKTAAG